MPAEIRERIEFLYGAQVAERIGARLEEIFNRFRAEQASGWRPVLPSKLSEQDVLLIAYGDQVQAAGVPPVQALGQFLESQVHGVVSGLHLLPFYPYSSDDGFSVIDYLAVDPQLGSWADIRRIDHQFDLMLDAVFNHVSAGSDWFRRFLDGDPAYQEYFIAVEGDPDLSRVVRPRALPLLTSFSTPAGVRRVWTTFSADQVDLNFANPEVLLAIVEALLFYVQQGARFIRLDAIAYLWKEPGTPCIHLPQTHCLIQLMRAALDETAPEVLLITETNVPHADNISYFGDGTNEAQLVYNFALPPLVLHTLRTGNASRLARWAATLETPSPRTTYLNFLASHDGIGVNPARGILTEAEIEALVQGTIAHGGLVSNKFNPDGSQSPYELNINYFDALSDPNSKVEPIETQVNRFLVAQAIMLALAGVPAIYFHSLFGSKGDRPAADSSGIHRRINRQKLQAADLIAQLADPGSLRARVFTRYRELLAARRAHPAFDPAGLQAVLPADDRLFVLGRRAPEGPERVLCIHNVSAGPVPGDIALGDAWRSVAWTPLFGSRGKTKGANAAFRLDLGPYEVWWARA